LITGSLQFPIAFDNGRIVLATSPPVLGIPASPLTRTVLADLSVFRIGGNSEAVVFAASPALAFGFAAYRLGRLKLGRLEAPLTETTPPFDHIGVCLTAADQAKSLEAFLE
jgi:hypothetical protein